MSINYADCKFYRGEKMTDLSDQEQLFIWEVEKEAFDAHLNVEGLRCLMRHYVEEYQKIGIKIAYPYES